MRALALVSVFVIMSCGGPPPAKVDPYGMLPAPQVFVSPPAGVFNDQLVLTFTSDRDATIYVSTDGSDPMKTSQGRQSGPAPFKVTLHATSTVKYFASAHGHDGALHTDSWTRAGGPIGTISGVVVVGTFGIDKDLGVFDNFNEKKLGQTGKPAEIPFVFTNVQNGAHRLTALMDLNGDGQLLPFIDFQSPTVSITIDLTDPFKASAENVRLYVGASEPDLGTIFGTITVPQPMLGTDLRISALSGSSLLGGTMDPTALLNQLQNGYQIFTNGTDTVYPYVITGLMPGSYIPAPALIGFGAGGVGMNVLADPLSPAIVVAGGETEKDFVFGPVSLTGTVALTPAMPPQQGGFVYGVIAAKTGSIGSGIQAVLMPTVFAPDMTMMGGYTGAYAGQALLPNATFDIKTFASTSDMNPLIDALTWAINPLGGTPPDMSLPVGSQNIVQNLTAH
jgi:hypothetical protein